MSYKHFGRIGDIWKHLPLCEFLQIEQPTSYIETNSAYPEYQLTRSKELEYGIFYLQQNIQKSQLIQESVYWQVLNSLPENKNSLSKYLGSPGLALNILKSACNFIFFDLELECLEAIKIKAQVINKSSTIVLKNEDSIEGLIKILRDLNSTDFIHCDPYSIDLKNSNNNSYFDAFCLAMKKGIKGMLWYGFNNIHERESLHQVFLSKKNTKGKTSLKGIEISSILLEKNILEVNPGILGCGILIGNLSDVSKKIFQEMAEELVKLYRQSMMFDRYSGELKSEEFEIII
ncbi:MAG: hypothetical protein AB4368_02885 [Xenococcaceae cyanobacterium]